MSIQIYDNFINQESMNQIKSVMLDNEFPWFLNNNIVYDNDSGPWMFQFTHNFYKDGQFVSSFTPIIHSILNNINYNSLLRIKANLGTITPHHIQGGWHVDNEFDSKTAVFYVNSNNGGTLIKESNQFIKSVENRFVVFDSSTVHTGISQTDTNTRCVINFNFTGSNNE